MENQPVNTFPPTAVAEPDPNFTRAPVPAPAPSPVAARPVRELKVEDALQYLDQVKMEFCNKPAIYNEFLEIMKSFKAQSINTPGVIVRVKKLFKGYNKLILGFNTFLPEGEGHKIELTPEEEAHGMLISQQNSAAAAAAAAASSGESGANAEGIPAGSVGETVPSGVSGAEANGATASAPVLATTTLATAAPLGHTGAVPSETAGAAKPQQQMQQQHAISYVTTIRNRFQNEPDTYRAFLKILHTYQKEQKGIKDVLEQVSQLFADHSDLLMEFTYFLPDAVQEQAKERLQRAAREADLRRHRNNMQFGAGGPMSTGKQGMLPMGGMSMGVLPMHPAASGRGAGSNKRQRNNERSASAAASMTDYQSQMMMMQQRNAVGFNVPGGGISPMSGSAMQNMQNMHYYNQQQQQFLSRQQQQQAPAVKGANGTGSRAKQARRKNGVDEPVAANAQVGPNGMVRKDNMSSVTILPPQPPQYNHLNVTAERRFFDQVKDFLYSISRESWHEFVRILELYSQEAVTKKDMLSLAEDLFGSAGSELFDEFKSLMNARVAYDTQGQDIWYGVPSSEIDFSQSRKCTPSYRALPKQYPKPICSARSEMEASVLNDEWVSIPIGSEESFSFKHMRKNQYEEALFRLEDERFEIDMVIDSNMCTIRVLEPMAEEIKLIKGLADTIQANAQGTKSAAASNTKLFNTKFNLQLDNRNISTIHLNAISRIYGDHGAEILELLRKNPATTIPTILLRLKQKDVEWRKARLELNNQWKDLLNKNYERSLDHSSYFFKLQDKKHYSARNLVADVKGVEVTNNQPMLPGTREDLLKQPGISFSVPKSESGKESSTADMNTSLALNYNNKSHAIHKDVYKIICHAAECTPSLSPFDKERIAALWRDLLRVFFNIPVTYMYGNLDENVQITPELIENTTINKDVDANTSDTWSVNTKVITLFGSGVIQSHNSDTKMYGVLLPKYGLVNMKPSCVIGAEELSISALNAIGVNRAQINDPTSDTIVNVPTLAELMASDKQALSAADLEELHRVQLSASAEPVENPSKIFYGTQMCYVFFRLHHTLFNRLEILQQLALDAEKKDLSSNRLSERGSTHKHPINPSYVYVPPTADNCDSSVAEETTVTPSTTPVNGEAESKVIEKKPVYPTFLGMVQSFVSGSMDTAGFEDAVRQLLGQNAYIAYTMDKLVQQMVKCLQAMAADETVTKLIGVFVYHRSKPEPVVPKLYQAHVAQLLLNSAEEVYRMQLVVDADELARGTGTSTIACGALAHLHTINASTVTDMGEALELDDAEDEEEAAAEEAVKLLSTTSEDAHVTEELEHLNENDGGEADNDDDEDLEDDDIELEMDHHQSQGEDQADSEDGESDMGVQDTENMMELENEAHSRAKRSRR